jgi:hypothetical protein
MPVDPKSSSRSPAVVDVTATLSLLFGALPTRYGFWSGIY